MAASKIALLALVASASLALADHPPTAIVPQGFLIGTTTSLPSATATVNKFLGIPYGAPPVRFEAPRLADASCATRSATAFGPACLQQADSLSAFSYQEPAQSEDCLFLNVWQPGGHAPTSGWPVMVWIHGGGLQFDSSDQPVYDGAAFAAYEDVVLVSFNYRLSLFGFPGAPGVPNLGFLDQRLALSWVYANIAAFHGNASKITIFGQSAGGASVSALLEMPSSPLPYRAAIIQSGTALSNAIGSIGLDPETGWNKTVAAFNCSTASNQLGCLRAIPASQLLAFATNNSLPTIIKDDNLTYTLHISQQYDTHKAAPVPLLVGTTTNEGTLFTLGQHNLTSYLQQFFGVLPSLIPNITATYSSITPDSKAIAQVFTEVGFQCPSAILAKHTSPTAPAWRYIFNATFPNTVPVPGLELGVYHSSELPLVFSTYNHSTATAQEFALSEYMRGAWARFARNPMAGPGWGRVGSLNGTDVGVLGMNGLAGVTMVESRVVDARCGLFELIYGLF